MVSFARRGEVILKNSLKCDYIFVVKSGTCQVLKRLNEVKPRMKPVFRKYYNEVDPFMNDEISGHFYLVFTFHLSSLK